MGMRKTSSNRCLADEWGVVGNGEHRIVLAFRTQLSSFKALVVQRKSLKRVVARVTRRYPLDGERIRAVQLHVCYRPAKTIGKSLYVWTGHAGPDIQKDRVRAQRTALRTYSA